MDSLERPSYEEHDVYRHTNLTDALHEVCGIRTDYQFITRQKMKAIPKRSEGRK